MQNFFFVTGILGRVATAGLCGGGGGVSGGGGHGDKAAGAVEKVGDGVAVVVSLDLVVGACVLVLGCHAREDQAAQRSVATR